MHDTDTHACLSYPSSVATMYLTAVVKYGLWKTYTPPPLPFNIGKDNWIHSSFIYKYYVNQI